MKTLINFKNICFLILFTILFSSCNTNEKLIKKFFNRLNNREINAGAQYIFPEDDPTLFIFYKLFLSKNKTTYFEILEISENNYSSTSEIIVKLKCNNCTTELYDFFKSETLTINNDILIDTFLIKTVNDNTYLAFTWGYTKLSNHLKLMTIKSNTSYIREGPGVNYKKINQLNQNDEILIDDTFKNEKWKKMYFFNEYNSISTGYISINNIEIKTISFFKVGIFEKFGFFDCVINSINNVYCFYSTNYYYNF